MTISDVRLPDLLTTNSFEMSKSNEISNENIPKSQKTNEIKSGNTVNSQNPLNSNTDNSNKIELIQSIQSFSGFHKRTVDERHLLLSTYLHRYTQNTHNTHNSPRTQPQQQNQSEKGASPNSGYQSKDLVPPQTRSRRLNSAEVVSSTQLLMQTLQTPLSLETANTLIENCIGTFSLPLGVLPTLLVNGRHFVVPMCTEESSVIAAASSAAKFIAENAIGGKGFNCQSGEQKMIGQIQLLDITDVNQAAEKILQHKNAIVDEANKFCISMVKRGGGVKDVQTHIRIVPNSSKRFIVVHLLIDTKDAMGANIVNTICEGSGPFIAELTGGRVGLRILSNLCLERLSTAEFSVLTKNLSYKSFSGTQVAKRLFEAYEFASADPYRACTNNKGFLNGLEAAALACGQDTRAIAASAFTYSCLAGQVQPLVHYRIQNEGEEDELLHVKCQLPISVGTVGGALGTHPTYAFNMALLGEPSSTQLSQILVCLGVCSNFSALRALALEGIQRGHMSLHASNVALMAGVSPDEKELMSEVIEYLQSTKRINQRQAIAYIQSRKMLIDGLSTDQSDALRTHMIHKPHTLFVEIMNSNGKETLTELHLLIPAIGHDTHHPNTNTLRLVITSQFETNSDEVHQHLFGKINHERLQHLLINLKSNSSNQRQLHVLIELMKGCIKSIFKVAPIDLKMFAEAFQNNCESFPPQLEQSQEVILTIAFSILFVLQMKITQLKLSKTGSQTLQQLIKQFESKEYF